MVADVGMVWDIGFVGDVGLVGVNEPVKDVRLV